MIRRLVNRAVVAYCRSRGWRVVYEKHQDVAIEGAQVLRRRFLHRLRKRSPDLLRRVRVEFDQLRTCVERAEVVVP